MGRDFLRYVYLPVELQVWELNFRKIMKEKSDDDAVGEPPSGSVGGATSKFGSVPLSMMVAVRGQDVLGCVYADWW